MPELHWPFHHEKDDEGTGEDESFIFPESETVIVTIVITDAAGNVRAVRDADFLVRKRRPRST